MRVWVALLLAGCGAPLMPVGFSVHPQLSMQCPKFFDGPLQARLEVSGVMGACELDVGADHQISGLCTQIPTGAERELRLVYFVSVEGLADPLDLAEARQKVDLTSPEDEVAVSFSTEILDIDSFDADGDKVSNLKELCDGRNPLDASG